MSNAETWGAEGCIKPPPAGAGRTLLYTGQPGDASAFSWGSPTRPTTGMLTLNCHSYLGNIDTIWFPAGSSENTEDSDSHANSFGVNSCFFKFTKFTPRRKFGTEEQAAGMVNTNSNWKEPTTHRNGSNWSLFLSTNKNTHLSSFYSACYTLNIYNFRLDGWSKGLLVLIAEIRIFLCTRGFK